MSSRVKRHLAAWMKIGFCCTALLLLLSRGVVALDRPGTTFKIFQFPPDQIPRIDGNADDWKMVPEDYAIGMDQLIDQNDPNHKPDASKNAYLAQRVQALR